MPEPPHVSVVIPAFGRPDELLAVLRGFRDQRLPASRFEVIVVDDGSPEPLAPRVAENPLPYPVRVLRQPNRGRSAARNAGVAASRGELLVFCDADRVPDPEFLAGHARAHDRPRPIAAVGVPLDCFYRRERLLSPAGAGVEVLRRFSRKPAYFRAVEKLFTDVASRGETDSRVAWAAFLVGNASVRRAHFQASGGFDEELADWGIEHFELGLRLSEDCGVAIELAPGAKSYHIPHPRDLERARRCIEEAVQFVARKHPTREISALQGFMFGDISLQEFERRYAGTISQALREEPPVYFRGLARGDRAAPR